MSLKAENWLEQEPESALTLPSRYFYDPGIFELEKQKIFMPAWHFLCHKSELEESGSYVVRDLFDQSIVAMKGRDGAYRAFHNVCQHRGNRLLPAGRGKTNAVIRCSYHSWCYGLDGALRSAPRSENIKDFDKSKFGLKEVRLEELAGFLFFNFDPDATPIKDELPGAEEAMIKNFPDYADLKLMDEQDVIVPANWKVIMDNAIEGYHFSLSGPVHQVLTSLINFDGYTLTQHDKWWTYIGPSDLSAEEAYGVPIEKKDPDDKFFNVNLWPYNTLYRFPFGRFVGTFLMIPLTPETSLLRFGYYSSEEAPSDIAKACMTWMNEELGPEDIDLNVTVQKGLRSLGYDQGRYMIDEERSNESEHLVLHFHKLVYQALHG